MKLFAVTTSWWEGDGRIVTDSGERTSVVYADNKSEAVAKALAATGDPGSEKVEEIDESLPLAEIFEKFGIKVIR